jgi:pimeloyl-ACP methyl ester carboxylesterase
MPYFSSQTAQYHYHVYGTGKQILLAFHGFGMRGTQFRVLEEALGQKYTIYSFDLFFHGETKLFDTSRKAVKKSINKKDFAQDMLSFLESINQHNQKFSLLSYSIGSKLALSLISEIPNQIEEAYFVAPDGIKPNLLLETGAKSKILNQIFWKLVYSPKTVKYLLNKLFRFKYIDASLHYILSKEFTSTETRLTCYNTITYFAELNLNKKLIINQINDAEINTHFYFGSKDVLFPPKIGKDFTKKLKNSNLHIINDGHDLVNSHLNSLMKATAND